MQIGERSGRLQFHVGRPSRKIQDIISKYQAESACICDECGEYIDRAEVGSRNSRFVQTKCKVHYVPDSDSE
jgi:formylmethanofuran dehydrogenase subunit E